MLGKVYRRVVVRRFGGARNALLWLLAVILTIYVLDKFVFPKHTVKRSSSTNSQADQQAPVEPAAPADKKLPEPPVEKKPDEPKPAEAKPSPKAEEAKPKPTVPPKPAEPPKPVTKSTRVGKACQSECPAGQISYYIKSGKDRDISPIMCFDGTYIMSEKKNPGKRGLNVVIVNSETFTVEDSRVFDIYQSDSLMIRYLKLGVQEGYYILAATLDDASYHLTEEGRNVLKRYGSSQIANLGFRDNLIMIGQRGLVEGSAVEKHMARKEGMDFSDTVEMSGCIDIPIGRLEPYIISEEERIELSGGARVGLDKPDCGVKSPCDKDSFSVQLFTGIENKYMTKVCVNGKYVFGEGLNDAGRGLNIAVVDPNTREVIRVGRFDTFGADSSNLEIFIEMLNEGEIVVLATYDEASRNFDLASQKMFQNLGSSFANKVTFRDAWVFVGQQGIKGYSPLEELAPSNGGWPKPIDKIVCVPTKLTGNESPLPDPTRLVPAVTVPRK